MIRNPKLRFPRNGMWVWKATWLFGWTVYPLFLRYRIEGEQNVPEFGACILASNHNYGVDFTLLGGACPRQVRFMTKAEAYRVNPLLTKYLYGLGTFPVERAKRDIGAIRTAVKILREGEVLGMFPEGTRSRTGELQEAKTGTARIAISANVPVVPAAVIGSPKLFKRFWVPVPRPEVLIRFGEPIRWDGPAKDETASIAFTEDLMLAIAALLPPEMRGKYAAKVEERSSPA